MLLDRLPERAALSQLLDTARAGRSGVLVMRGEPGVGKTALLEYAIESATGLRVTRAAGVESEMELAFASLQQLCAPMLDKLEALPDPQRAALGVAFGLKTGAAPDRFLVGLAALSLLSEVAEQQPLLCVIDDAQWLDRASAQTLAAAAEPAGEPALVWRAAERLGIGAEAVAPAADAGLLAIGERVVFRHPLVRSAVYRAASPRERRAAHQALAGATDSRADPDRRAWHRAQATLGPDEDVASELERSAGRAQARGGLAAAAAFLERAAALTLDPARRAERALAAAQATYQAGAFDA